MKLGTNLHHVSGIAQEVSKVKEQRSRRGQMHFSGGGIHFNGMKLRLTLAHIIWTYMNAPPIYA